MAVTKDTKASFGILATIKSGSTEITGILVDCSFTRESVLASEQNEVGSIIGQYVQDKKYTVSGSFEVPANTQIPSNLVNGSISEDTVLTIGGSGVEDGAYYLTGCGISESNTSYIKISVSGERYPLCEKITDGTEV